jgi:hypothetical protein
MILDQIAPNLASRLLIDAAVAAVAVAFPVGLIARCFTRIRRAARDGVVYDGPGKAIRRADDPSTFWFVLTTNLAMIALSAGVLALATVIALQMILLRMKIG